MQCGHQVEQPLTKRQRTRRRAQLVRQSQRARGEVPSQRLHGRRQSSPRTVQPESVSPEDTEPAWAAAWRGADKRAADMATAAQAAAEYWKKLEQRRGERRRGRLLRKLQPRRWAWRKGSEPAMAPEKAGQHTRVRALVRTRDRRSRCARRKAARKRRAAARAADLACFEATLAEFGVRVLGHNALFAFKRELNPIF